MISMIFSQSDYLALAQLARIYRDLESFTSGEIKQIAEVLRD